MTLLTEVKNQIKEDEKRRKESLEKFQIKQMLSLIGSRKKRIGELQEEVSMLERKLDKKEYISPIMGSNGFVWKWNIIV